MSNYKNFFNLDETTQLEILDKLHNGEQASLPKIAELLDTYPNKVRRVGVKLGFKFRDKSESQKVALQTGAASHPTKGRKRTAAEKKAISDKMAVYWENISDEDLADRVALAKENWDNLSLQEKEYIHSKAVAGRLEAAKHGSKLEKIVMDLLIKNGYRVNFHVEQTLLNEKFHLDLMIPELKTAIEIDGPTHFEPIWGEERLQKTKDADNRKDGLLLSAGFYVVRVRQHKNVSNKLVRDVTTSLLEVLDKIKNQDPQKRFII